MLGKIEKTDNNFEMILFEDSYKVKAILRQSSAAFTEFEGAFDRPGSTAIWIGEEDGKESLHFDRGKVESLVAHLQAWLATGSFEIKTGPPTRPGREPVSETVTDEKGRSSPFGKVKAGSAYVPTDNPLYLLQNCSAGYVGNSPVFWAEGNSGYTPFIDEARRFTVDQACDIVLGTRGSHTWQVWALEEIESVAKKTVDIQDLRKIGSTFVEGEIPKSVIQ